MGVTVMDLIGTIKGWHGIDDPDNEDAITNARCLEWINWARERICRVAVYSPYTEEESTIDIKSTERTTELPDGWLAYDSLYQIDDEGNHKSVIWYPVKKLFDARYPDRTKTGEVVAGTQYGKAVVWAFIPTVNTKIYTSQRRVPDPMVNTADSDDLLVDLRTTIEWGALVISSEWATVPEEKQAKWEAHFQTDLDILHNQYAIQKNPPNRIISSGYGAIFPRDDSED
jgi:hypothetical protein